MVCRLLQRYSPSGTYDTPSPCRKPAKKLCYKGALLQKTGNCLRKKRFNCVKLPKNYIAKPHCHTIQPKNIHGVEKYYTTKRQFYTMLKKNYAVAIQFYTVEPKNYTTKRQFYTAERQYYTKKRFCYKVSTRFYQSEFHFMEKNSDQPAAFSSGAEPRNRAPDRPRKACNCARVRKSKC
jgi:hypothetical protein